MDDKWQQALEQAYRWEHGADQTIFPALDAMHGSLGHQFMVLGTILADKGLFIFYFLLFIVLGLASRLLPADAAKRQAKTVLWIDVIGTFVLTFIIGSLAVHYVKHSMPMPRPFVGLPPEEIAKLGALVEKGEDNMSFPSGHAFFATVIAVSLWPVLRDVGKLIACLFVLWAASSRVVLGLHHPIDVIGGIILALVIALIIRAIIRLFLRNQQQRIGGL